MPSTLGPKNFGMAKPRDTELLVLLLTHGWTCYVLFSLINSVFFGYWSMLPKATYFCKRIVMWYICEQWEKGPQYWQESDAAFGSFLVSLWHRVFRMDSSGSMVSYIADRLFPRASLGSHPGNALSSQQTPEYQNIQAGRSLKRTSKPLCRWGYSLQRNQGLLWCLKPSSKKLGPDSQARDFPHQTFFPSHTGSFSLITHCWERRLHNNSGLLQVYVVVKFIFFCARWVVLNVYSHTSTIWEPFSNAQKIRKAKGGCLPSVLTSPSRMWWVLCQSILCIPQTVTSLKCGWRGYTQSTWTSAGPPFPEGGGPSLEVALSVGVLEPCDPPPFIQEE